MKSFRKLTNNLLFKIFLSFVALSFVFFGISGFLLGGSDNWVAKVGDTTINFNRYQQALKADREIVLSSSNSQEAIQYLDSPQFKSDVLGRLTNRAIIEKLHEDLGIEASKNLILKSIAQDPSFKNEEGKFDHTAFTNFLTSKGYNEERYVQEIADNVVATMAIQTLSMAAPIDLASALEEENFNQEKRLANVVTISSKNVRKVATPSQKEITEFFAENQHQYQAPEFRKLSILRFSKQDFAKDFEISEADIRAEYEAIKDQLKTEENRSFYHVVFDKEEDAQSFSDKLAKGANFVTLAKQTQNKTKSDITLANVTQKNLPPELADKSFKLTLNKASTPLKSPLGFHVLLLTNIEPSSVISFEKAKSDLKKSMVKNREENVLQDKLALIDDSLLESNSLNATAKKFNFKTPINVTTNNVGRDEKDQEVKEIAGLSKFIENAFLLKKGQVSKIFYLENAQNKTPQEFYIIQLDRIVKARSRELSEIKAQVTADLKAQNTQKALTDLVKKIGDEITANPKNAASIASKYRVKFEKNREFSRLVYFQVQGRQVPYQNQFLKELFDAKIGQATSVVPAGESEFVIGVLQKIKPSTITSAEFAASREKIEKAFKTEILQEYNSFLLEKNPVKVNEQILSQ